MASTFPPILSSRTIAILLLGITCFQFSALVVSGQQVHSKRHSIQAGKQPHEMTVPDAIEHARPFIVQIRVTYQTRRVQNNTEFINMDNVPSGTGFLINEDGYVLTALHVISAALSPDPSLEKANIKVGIGVTTPYYKKGETMPTTGEFFITPALMVDKDEAHDLALLKLTDNLFKLSPRPKVNITSGPAAGEYSINISHAFLSPERPRDGTQIAVSGYPFDGTLLMTNIGWLSTSAAIHPNAVQKLPGGLTEQLKPGTQDAYLGDLTINPGNSGGPVYTTSSGRVIGVCVAFKNAVLMTTNEKGISTPITDQTGKPIFYNSGVSEIIPIKYAVDLLIRNKVRYSLNQAGN